MDCNAVWSSLASPSSSVLAPHAARLPPFLAEFATHLLRAAPIVTVRDSIGARIELHSAPNLAGPRNWHWLIPVRTNAPAFPLDRAIREIRDIERIGRLRNLWHICEGDVIDILAVSIDLKRVIGRMTGHAVALGHPMQDYPLVNDDERIRVFSSVESWVLGKLEGVVMLGSQAENAKWLHNFAGGVICDDVAHGKSIDRLLRKPYKGPPVLVAA
jgi:hypothetical protein